MAAANMTEGNAFRHMLAYSVPLVLGNLFQLAYNAVDSIIVGRFIGKEALAAVGTAGPVANLIILGISGVCIGASVLMSGFYGAGRLDLLKREMSTTVIMGMWFSAIVAAVGILSSDWLMRFLKAPGEARGMAAVYLRVIFLGTPFTYLYNAVSSALKSVGDSKTPLHFLAFASVLNGALDCLFIGVFRFGIVCSAVTTVVAEASSAFLCIWYVYRKIPMLRLMPDELCIDRHLLGQTLRYGCVTALQQACQPVGKLLIQRAVNPMGVDVVAAFTAVSRVDDFAFTPEQSISHGITIFVAQNRGAGQTERIKDGLKRGLALEFLYWILVCAAITAFKTPVMGLFVSGTAQENAMVIQMGCGYLSLMALFYVLPGFTNGMQGYFRGMGIMEMTLAGTVIQTTLRVLSVYLLVPVLGIRGVAYACAVGWAVMLLVEVPCYWLLKGGPPGCKRD